MGKIRNKTHRLEIVDIYRPEQATTCNKSAGLVPCSDALEAK